MTTTAALAAAMAMGVRKALRSTAAYVLEPTKGPWVNQNTFGDQRFAPLPATAGQVMNVLPKNTGLYGPPQVHSLQLGRSDDVPTQNADVYARITLGCGGVENSFDCDWLHGLQLAVVCNSVSVQAVTYAPNGGAPYSTSGASVALKAMVAKGSVQQGRCPATYTQASVIVPDGGGSAVYNVPDFAREVTAHMVNNNDPGTPNGVQLTFLNQGGTALALYDGQVCAGGRAIPIPGGANTFRIDNGTGSAVPLTVQWFLGL